MSPKYADPSRASFHFLNHILSTTPTHKLAPLLPCLVSTIENCGDVFANPQKLESTVSLHKYKTKLSALLYGKDIEGRLVAAALIKSTTALGKWGMLQDCNAWVRGLIAIIGKPDLPATKTVCIITLTNIFLLSCRYPTLVREISTPALPSFITSCLDLVTITPFSRRDNDDTDESDPFLGPVLFAFSKLLQRYPTVFRPFAARIQDILRPVLAPTPSAKDGKSINSLCPPQVVNLAVRVFIRLQFCVPKGSADREWAAAYRGVVVELDTTADHVFRSVVERRISASSSERVDSESSAGIFGQRESTSMGLPGWNGIAAGVERVIGLLDILRQFYLEPTISSISLPLGMTVDLLTRVFSVADSHEDSENSRRRGLESRTEDIREEQEGLWVGLPQIHVAALKVLSAMMDRLGLPFLPLAQNALEQVTWIYDTADWNTDIRTVAYAALAKILKLTGFSISEPISAGLSHMIHRCCDDCFFVVRACDGAYSRPTLKNGKKLGDEKISSFSTNADAYLGTHHQPTFDQAETSIKPSDFHQAAWALLPLLISHIPSNYLEFSLRVKIDHTAILMQHKSAMMASVLCPPQIGGEKKILNSIIPHLARAYGGEPETEGLLRPRMPVVNVSTYHEAPYYLDETSVGPEPMSMDEHKQDHTMRKSVADDHTDNLSSREQKGSPSPVKEGGADTPSTHETTKRLEGQLEPLPTVPTDDATSGSMDVATTMPSHADQLRHIPPFSENEHPSKRVRIDSPRNMPENLRGTADQAPSMYVEEQPGVVLNTASETLQIPIGSATEDPSNAVIEERDPQDSDDSFEVPRLVIDADTDDEVDEEEEEGGDDDERR